jgi:hypothetical protein
MSSLFCSMISALVARRSFRVELPMMDLRLDSVSASHNIVIIVELEKPQNFGIPMTSTRASISTYHSVKLGTYVSVGSAPVYPS